MRRWYDEMHAEEVAWRQRLLEERITAFSARVLPGGVVPTLETLPPSEALTKVRAFAQSRSEEQGLVLLGEVGVGKTTLLLALVRSLAEQFVAEHKVVRLVTVPDFLCELRAGYDATQQQQGESYHALMERYQTCDVLVFDDLGWRSSPTGWKSSFTCSWTIAIASACRCWRHRTAARKRWRSGWIGG